ncbi:hypothetical protein [Nitrosopumilus sp. b2]|uniref:hypothetical protein n=1 Tax=Nitrosopumilus sp. b2 TaxID=2109908 RepID=UPI0015F5B22D|nr:hypothetical protein [Nitrosopumilus sp. b2]
MSDDKVIITELNTEKDLWTNIGNIDTDLRKYRATTCPIKGDDDEDIDDDLDTI